MKTINFLRDYKGYTGGHQKVADYFDHFLSYKDWHPEVYFTDDSYWDSSNPWLTDFEGKWGSSPIIIKGHKNCIYSDAIFLAGLDWEIYERHIEVFDGPIINLIQHIRHADPGDPRFNYLKKKAIRICVSSEVANVLSKTGRVNGPVYTIENGIKDENSYRATKRNPVFVLGLKNPKFALELARKIRNAGVNCKISIENLTKEEVLTNMGEASITVALPHKTEGFYLPGLEAMMLSDLAIVPDCVGNRGFCIDKVNCFRPDYQIDEVYSAVLAGLNILKGKNLTDRLKRFRLRVNVGKTICKHSLKNERTKLMKIVRDLDEIWKTS